MLILSESEYPSSSSSLSTVFCLFIPFASSTPVHLRFRISSLSSTFNKERSKCLLDYKLLWNSLKKCTFRFSKDFLFYLVKPCPTSMCFEKSERRIHFLCFRRSDCTGYFTIIEISYKLRTALESFDSREVITQCWTVEWWAVLWWRQCDFSHVLYNKARTLSRVKEK